MREFASLLFAVALAAHLGSAGAPSLGVLPEACVHGAGLAAAPSLQLSDPAVASGPLQTEVRGDGGPWSPRSAPRRADPGAGLPRGRSVADSAAGHPDALIHTSLLGLSGNPATAPPLLV